MALGAVAESPHPDLESGGRERGRDWARCGLLKSRSPPPVTHSSKNATNPSSTTGNQTLEYTSLTKQAETASASGYDPSSLSLCCAVFCPGLVGISYCLPDTLLIGSHGVFIARKLKVILCI